MGVDTFRHQELGVLRPAISPFGQAYLFFAERFAMSFGCVLLVRRTIANMAVQNDESGPAFGLLEHREGVLDALKVVGVSDAKHIPAIGEEARGHVFRKRDARIA